MAAIDGPITVNVLTGFLGSGKTTLLRRLLRSPALHDSAVLINEFGEIGLDHFLIERVDGDAVLLQSGCVCCTIRGDLRDSVRDLYDRRQRGDLPAFRRLIIETTGLADPAPIVQTLVGEPVLRHHFVLGNVVTLVDSVTGADTLARHEEASKQVAVADRLVLSKTDLASPAEVARLEGLLRRVNPTAALDRTEGEAGPAPDRLLTSDVVDPESRAAAVANWLAEAAPGDHDHGSGHHASADVNRHGDIAAVSLVLDEPLDWTGFGVWLTMLLNRHGQDVLRVKGLLNIAGVETPVVLHGVQHVIHPPVHLAAWPGGDTRTRLVFIGRGLDGELLKRSFRAFLALGGAG